MSIIWNFWVNKKKYIFNEKPCSFWHIWTGLCVCVCESVFHSEAKTGDELLNHRFMMMLWIVFSFHENLPESHSLWENLDAMQILSLAVKFSSCPCQPHVSQWFFVKLEWKNRRNIIHGENDDWNVGIRSEAVSIREASLPKPFRRKSYFWFNPHFLFHSKTAINCAELLQSQQIIVGPNDKIGWRVAIYRNG